MSQVTNKWGWLWVVVLGSGLIGCGAGSQTVGGSDGSDGTIAEEEGEGDSDTGEVSDIPYGGSIETAVNEYFPLAGLSQQENRTRQAASECPTYPSGADKSFSNSVSAGHYGRPSAGVSLSSAITCDASNAATAWQSWRIVDTSTIDCDGLSLDFQGGSGVISVGELHDLAIYGTFTLSGVSVHCDIVFGVQSGASGDMSVSCETDDGTAVSGGEDDPQCSMTPGAGEDPSEMDDDGDDDFSDEWNEGDDD